MAHSDHYSVLSGATNPDRWVPQLGSKKLGTRDNGVTYNYKEILKDYYRLSQRYPGALLLWSGDWSTFDESDYWVTVANVTYPTAAGALGWCLGQGLADNDCYAKLISTTHGVDGSTAHNSR